MNLKDILFEAGMQKYYQVLIAMALGVAVIFFFVWLGGTWLQTESRTANQIEEELRDNCWSIRKSMDEYISCLGKTSDYMDWYIDNMIVLPTSTQEL